MNKFLLRILDLLKGVYRLAGVNYEQVRAIVDVKLTMDNRRHVVAVKQKKENKESKNTMMVTLFIYAIFGIFTAMMVFTIKSVMVSMIFFSSYIMVMIAMTLITDFSSILLDTSDNTIILPRPVEGRTLFAARITHILIYLGLITSSLSFFTIIVVGFKYGIVFLLAFLFTLVLSILTAVLITNVVYLVIMQFASEEKLKAIINYFQIVMAVVFMGGYQLLPRMMGRFDVADYTFDIVWWHYFIPSIWMGGALELIYYNLFDVSHLILACLAITFPIGGLYVTNKYLSPLFSRKLAELGASTEVIASRTDEKPRNNVFIALGDMITIRGLERASFNFIFKMLGRDRKIKLKIYPSIGYILIFGFIFILKGHEDISTTWHHLPETKYYLLLIYFTYMVTQTALGVIPFSDDYRASWFYTSAPIEKPGEILMGMVKAIFVRLYLPVYVAISVFIVFVWGVSALDDVFFGLLNNIIIMLTIAAIGKKMLPLSVEPGAQQKGNFIRGILLMLCMAIPAGVHYLIGFLPTAMLWIFPIQLLIIYFLMRMYRETSWDDITA